MSGSWQGIAEDSHTTGNSILCTEVGKGERVLPKNKDKPLTSATTTDEILGNAHVTTEVL